MTTVYYVAANGNDHAQGSLDDPFLTISRAQKEVREQLKNGISHDLAVNIRGGLYELDDTLSFDERDSGKEGCPIYYSSFPGEKAVIAGGR